MTQKTTPEEEKRPEVVEIQVKPHNEDDWWRGLLMVFGLAALVIVWMVLSVTSSRPIRRMADSWNERDFRSYPKEIYQGLKSFVKSQVGETPTPPPQTPALP